MAAVPSFRDLVAASFKVGCLGFGGPAGQIALMRRIFVEEKKWIDEARFLHALNYCMLLPGPEAQQLATYVGWLLHGVKGGIVAGALFVIPGAALIFALSWAYAAHGTAPLVAAAFYGVKAGVVALIAEALVKVGKRSLKSSADGWIAATSFLALFLFGLPFPLVILGAAALGAFRGSPAASPDAAPTPAPPAATAFKAAALWGGLWLAPLALCLVALGPRHVLTEVAVLFSKLAVVTFGGAYAVLAYLEQEAVSAQGWIEAGQMMDGFGLAETTPGPLILVNQFVGFLAGWRAPGGGLLIAAAAAFLASWQTFAASYLWIFAGAPYAERLRASRRAAGALKGIGAAVIGVIAAIGWSFAARTLFARSVEWRTPFDHAVTLPAPASCDPVAALIALAAGTALLRFKASVVLVVLACLAAGAAAGLARGAL